MRPVPLPKNGKTIALYLGVLGLALILGCSSIPSTPTPSTNPAASPSTPGPSVSKPSLHEVPMVNREKHSVPLEDIVFDTFGGSFIRFTEASVDTIEVLRDAIAPIYTPSYGDPDELPWFRENFLVIGYESESGAYAYPITILRFHELVNDIIEGVPILVSYCPLCGSGIVYSRQLDGEILTFGNTGALYESDLVMYDHRTGSYWFQVLGEAIAGDMTGQKLTLLPSMTTYWGEWVAVHPDSRLLTGFGPDGSDFSNGLYGRDPSKGGVKAMLETGRFPFPVSEEKLDDRLPVSERILTVEVGGAAKAYPLWIIGDAAINDTVGGKPIVVFSRARDLGIRSGAAFLATMDGSILTFQDEDGAFTDIETSSTWNIAGAATGGPLEGNRLEPLPSRRAYWFSIAGAIRGLDLYLPWPCRRTLNPPTILDFPNRLC